MHIEIDNKCSLDQSVHLWLQLLAKEDAKRRKSFRKQRNRHEKNKTAKETAEIKKHKKWLKQLIELQSYPKR
jgi:hypothetical protein